MPLPPNRLNALRLVQGATKKLLVRVRDHSGRPVALTSADVIMTVRRAAGTDPLIEKKVGAGVEITDPAKGIARVTLDVADTTGLAAGSYRYDVWVVLVGPPEERYAVVRFAELVVVDSVTEFEA